MTDDTTTEDTLNENEEGSDKGTLDQSLPDQTSKEDPILDQQPQDTVISSTQITQDDAVSPTIYNQVQQNQDETVQPGYDSYILEDGAKARGWTVIDNTEYYFDTYNGSVTKDLLTDGYLVDEEGAKISTPGWYKRYPKNGNPTMHYIKPDGKLAVGWYEVDGNEYLFDQIRGSMV